MTIELLLRTPLVLMLLALGDPNPHPGTQAAGDDGVGGIEFSPRHGNLAGGSRLGGGSPSVLGAADHGHPGGGDTGPWSDLGQGTPGTHGVPVLTATGQPVEQGTVSFSLMGLTPGAPVIFIIGFEEISAPLLGGTLVPSPDWISPTVFANGAGMIMATGTVAEALPPGFTAVIQAWAVDVGAPQGFAASNGLTLTAP